MVVNALAGALGFCSRFPVGRDDAHWAAFRRTPTAFPLAGYVVGAALALPVALAHPAVAPVPAPTVALVFVLGVYAVTGINHLDGVADLGDAAVIHGDPTARREVMHDSAVGVGGALAVALVVLGLATAGFAIAALPVRAVALVVVAEVAAKACVAGLVAAGSAAHDGLGATLTRASVSRSVVPVAAVATPATLVTWPRLAPGIAAMGGAVAATALVWLWARRALGGVSGDVFGATNELARIAALHAGVIAWTLS